ncbi:synaptonemal complex central element protein 2-like [Dreissena polymorpha]|uniref:Uncharacterized protein n=1 Tax=Dreissena polymorpha TaxID=45954 RepID=A0A9D4N2M9_DREPO|nr:synaptonemal complex central element protein 2-like [Dreissena polymorpha]XP_052234747.1 synaptonemal complex central element protein 2-like [Dreissena polymorpha]KAH3888532.1 hypothetical protein DPMN_012568 [Dreissena polymorpha]
MEKEDNHGYSGQKQQCLSEHRTRTSIENRLEGDANNLQAEQCLDKLYAGLLEPLVEKPTAKYIADTAQQLVADLNDKRKTDSQLLESFRQSLEQETARMFKTVQQQMYQSYEVQSALVDQKLQELFACLDKISATEAELQTFRQSLKNLFQEMHAATSPELSQ